MISNKYCYWKVLEKGTKCTECGFPLPKTYQTPPVRMCGVTEYREPSLAVIKHRQGLGDLVEKLLDSIGITKDRVKEVTDKFGWPPCNCEENQEWLNQVGKHFGIGVSEE